MTPERIEEIKRDAQQESGTIYGNCSANITNIELLELLVALEEARKNKVKLWECEDCGFSFNAIHTDLVDGKDTGEHSCPLCAETRLEKELAEAKEINAKWALDELFADESEDKRQLAEAQQVIKNADSKFGMLHEELLIAQTDLREAQQTIARLTDALDKIMDVTGEDYEDCFNKAIRIAYVALKFDLFDLEEGRHSHDKDGLSQPDRQRPR